MEEIELHKEIIELKKQVEIEKRLADIRLEVNGFKNTTGLAAGNARQIFYGYEQIIKLLRNYK